MKNRIMRKIAAAGMAVFLVGMSAGTMSAPHSPGGVSRARRRRSLKQMKDRRTDIR